MGAGQALALQPGVSRSGVTITVGRFIGFDRAGAARISFLMSLIITAGAVAFKLGDVMAGGGIPRDFYAPFIWGIAASAVTGWVAVWATLKLVTTRTFMPFVVYRVVAGVGVLALLASSFR
jgi:undecaprenyl-diphosphatase